MSVTIELPGRTMMTPQECGENPKNYDAHSVVTSAKCFDKKTNKSFYKKETIHFRTRKCIPAYQSINMSSEAYDYMTSASCPGWFNKGVGQWKRMSSIHRLEEHLERLCKGLNGKSYTYVVFDD